jgi:uncharacterized repeat protein (TIGR01451 family)
MFPISRWAALAAACACAALPLAAQQASPIESRLESRKVVVSADGKETLAPADKAGPGDVIEYAATYRNTGKQTVKNLVATLPIPDQTEFIPGSAKPATAKAGLDANTFAEMPLKRTVTRNGVSVEQPVPSREYRYLRWFPGELGGDKSVTFTARVRILDNAPPADPGKGGGK